jgi:Na+/alanine symporter
MGPVRRRLIAALALWPQAALAEVCTTTRPDWLAEDGPITGGAETLYILTSPLGLGLVALIAVALVFPRRWLAVVAALPALALAGLLFISRQSDVATEAMATGCIGSAWPAVILLVLAAAMVLVRGFRA